MENKKDLYEELETERLMLKKITIDDVDDLYNNIFNNYNYYKYYYQLPIESINEYSEIVNKYEKLYESGNHFRWGLVLKETNETIGVVILHTKDNLNKNCKIGYVLSYNHNNNGYMSEALACILSFAFSKLDYHRVEAEIVSSNDKSIKLMNSLGMKEEGTRHDSYLLDGEYYNQKVYAKINKVGDNNE